MFMQNLKMWFKILCFMVVFISEILRNPKNFDAHCVQFQANNLPTRNWLYLHAQNLEGRSLI